MIPANDVYERLALLEKRLVDIEANLSQRIFEVNKQQNRLEYMSCPFCGSDIIECVSHGSSYNIICEGCWAQTSRYVTSKQAWAAWDRRA